MEKYQDFSAAVDLQLSHTTNKIMSTIEKAFNEGLNTDSEEDSDKDLEEDPLDPASPEFENTIELHMMEACLHAFEILLLHKYSLPRFKALSPQAQG